jgi:hypothetical protein
LPASSISRLLLDLCGFLQPQSAKPTHKWVSWAAAFP